MSTESAQLPTLPTVVYPSGPLPEFTEPIDDKYKCIVHNHVLQEAMQTPCGHRLCKACWDGIIQNLTSVPCPAKEDECSMITPDNVSYF